jgi:hypothetical protein
MSQDNNIIYLDEVRLKESIDKSERAINKARKLSSQGIALPEGLMGRLENIRDSLEKKLIDLIENIDAYEQ